MKTINVILITLFLACSTSVFAQMAVNTDGTSANTSAMLDVKSSDKGFLAPRMIATERAAISSPAAGLLVYQTDAPAGYYYYNGSAWTQLGIASAATQWTTSGNNIYYNTGNVGIGTTTPSAKLDVQGATNSSDFRVSRDPASATNYYTYITAPGDTPGRSFIGVSDANQSSDVLTITSDGKLGVNIGNAEPIGKLHVKDGAVSLGTTNDINTEFIRNDGTYNPRLQIRHSTAGTDIHHTYSSGAGNLTFSLANVEAMRIDANRNVGIGTTDPGSYRLYVNGSAGGTTAWNNLSDKRFKKDVLPINSALQKVMALQGITFNWDKSVNSEINFDDKNHFGFLAQDIEKILPQVVNTADDEMQTKSVAYSDVVPVLVEAIKEQQKQIETLKTQNALLMQDNQSLMLLKAEVESIKKALESQQNSAKL